MKGKEGMEERRVREGNERGGNGTHYLFFFLFSSFFSLFFCSSFLMFGFSFVCVYCFFCLSFLSEGNILLYPSIYPFAFIFI